MFAQLAYDKARRSLWLAWLLDNPLLVREIRRRMRGKLFSWSLISYVAALGGVSCVIMFVTYPIGEIPWREMSQKVGSIGMTLFTGMKFVEGFIALFIAPMLTAGIATAEKEKDTFDFLRVTTLHERTFVLGCLLTTASFLMLVFACTLPILGLTFVFGGVSMSDILWFNLLLFLFSMSFSAWGVFNSTNYSRSRSVQGSLVVVIFLFAYFGYGMLRSVGAPGFYSVSSAMGWGSVALSLAPLILAIISFSLMASRRLYDPNNRLFNYRQFSLFFALLLGAVGGTLWWRSTYAVKAPPADEVEFMLSLYYYLGALLMLMAILVFATGRIERGDEVWRVRLRVPFFRRVHEDLLLYFFYAAAWTGLVYALSAAYAPTAKFEGMVNDTLPILVSALIAAWSFARLSNGVSETRNKSMIIVALLLFLFWAIMPALGYFLNAVTRGPLQTALTDMLAAFLRDLSPFPSAIGLAVGNKWVDPYQPIVLQSILAILAAIPTFAPWYRRRLAVSYRWDVEGKNQGGSRLFISESVKALRR